MHVFLVEIIKKNKLITDQVSGSSVHSYLTLLGCETELKQQLLVTGLSEFTALNRQLTSY